MTIYIDTETTGLYSSDEIVEIAVIDDHSVLLNTLVRPVRHDSWPEAEYIHGISPQDVIDAPTYAEIKNRVRELVTGQEVVIYNADYDGQYLSEELQAAASVRCCMLLFAEHYGDWNDYYDNYRWQKLTTAAAYVHHSWSGEAHRALSDALAARSVWRYLTDKGEKNRVDALRKQAAIERQKQHENDLANSYIRLIENRLLAEKEARIAKQYKKVCLAVRRYLSPSDYPNRTADFASFRESDIYQAFTGYDKGVALSIHDANQRGLPVFEGGQVPAGYTTADKSGRQLTFTDHHGLLISARGAYTTLLYKKRRIQHLPKIYYGWESMPAGMATETTLKRDYKVPKKIRDTLKTAAVIETRYMNQKKWYSVYKIPAEYREKNKNTNV